jgi:hypothetical protein
LFPSESAIELSFPQPADAAALFSTNASTLEQLVEQRAVVRFLTLKWLKSGQIVTELEAIYGSDSLTVATVKKWSNGFRQGRTDLFDNPR